MPRRVVLAAKAGVLANVVALLQEGADPDVADEQGRTALFHAAEQGFLDVVRCLLGM